MKTNFSISTCTCADLLKGDLEQHNVHYIVMRYILSKKEIGECYSSTKEIDAFYDLLKNGAFPSTVALSEYEIRDYFFELLNKTEGDIIHVSLSSGLSLTCGNCMKVAMEINKTLKGRQIYVVDSLLATCAMAQLVDELIILRDTGKTTLEALKRVTELRDHQQSWILINDLFYLKRGGRIGGVKATLSTIFNLKPIIVGTEKGELAIENEAHGAQSAVNYTLGKMKETGEKANENFFKNTIYLYRTSKSQMFDRLKAAIRRRYPDLKIKEGVVGPIVGTHFGCGAAIVVYEGSKKLDMTAHAGDKSNRFPISIERIRVDDSEISGIVQL